MCPPQNLPLPSRPPGQLRQRAQEGPSAASCPAKVATGAAAPARCRAPCRSAALRPLELDHNVYLKKCGPCMQPSLAHVLTPCVGHVPLGRSLVRPCQPQLFGCRLQKLSQWVGDYTQLGIQAARARSLQQPRALHRPSVKGLHSQHSLAAVDHAGSRTLFRWLIRACLLYELLQWLQVRGLQPELCDRAVLASAG